MKTVNCVGSASDRRTGHRGARQRLLAALCVALYALYADGTAADYPLEMIELRARFPEDLIPILAPLAGPDGTILGANNTLFVRASPAHLAEIRRALTTLDRPPRSLLIQVRQRSANQTGGAWVGVGVGARSDPGYHRDGRGGPGTTRIEAVAGSSSGSHDLSQEVRALDGHRAFIAIGREQPVAYRDVTVGPGGTVIREGSTYQRNESGFYVVPRVQGDQVILEVETRADTGDAVGTRQTSEILARVQGRLGDWLPLALHTDDDRGRTAGTLFYGQAARSTQGRVELRVLPLD